MKSRGFTMVELMIALAIVAMLAGITVPVMDNITRADLRASASKTSGMVKAVYDFAVLNGHPSRLVFDFATNSIIAEQGSGKVTIADKDADQKDEPKEDEGKNDGNMDSLVAMAKRDVNSTTSVKRAATWTRVPGTLPYELPSGVKIASVMAEHLKDPQTEGKAVVHFFPMGYCEHAIVHFEDSSQRTFAVEIEPLTGRTRIVDHKVEYQEPK
jgi:general secretion pathway protein H